MSTSTAIITRYELEQLAGQWDIRADRLAAEAEGLASRGHHGFAAELRAAAAEYRATAERLAPGRSQ